MTMSHRFCVAPMIDWTDRHCRAFHRTLSHHARLYTEMITANAIRFGDRERLLGFDALDHPVALQLGGSEPEALAEAARIGAEFGYDEINMNVGCPSDRVQRGRFGACLMAEPALVSECVSAMRSTGLPVTVKSRIGIDDRDSYEALADFVATVVAGGCELLIVHARKAWLNGLSPKENREIPPLCYDVVHRLKSDFYDLPIVLNGGLEDVAAGLKHVERGLDGMMLGRAAYRHPWRLSAVDPVLFGAPAPIATETDAVHAHLPYIARQLEKGEPLQRMTRHMLGLFQGRPGARRWRQILGEEARRPGAGVDVVHAALAAITPGAEAQAA